MKKWLVFIMVVGCLCSCGHGRQQEVERFRMKVRSHYLEKKLAEAQQELARTDSIMQKRGVDVDSTPGYMDSLEMAADGLITLTPDTITVNTEGRPFVRCVAAALDPLMRHTDKNFSKPI